MRTQKRTQAEQRRLTAQGIAKEHQDELRSMAELERRGHHVEVTRLKAQHLQTVLDWYWIFGLPTA